MTGNNLIRVIGGRATFLVGYNLFMKSNLETYLENNLQQINEVKSITGIQMSNRYGFILELESPLGTYYCPVEGYKTKVEAIRKLRAKITS